MPAFMATNGTGVGLRHTTDGFYFIEPGVYEMRTGNGVQKVEAENRGFVIHISIPDLMDGVRGGRRSLLLRQRHLSQELRF
jgi:hypothetical protein